MVVRFNVVKLLSICCHKHFLYEDFKCRIINNAINFELIRNLSPVSASFCSFCPGNVCLLFTAPSFCVKELYNIQARIYRMVNKCFNREQNGTLECGKLYEGQLCFILIFNFFFFYHFEWHFPVKSFTMGCE